MRRFPRGFINFYERGFYELHIGAAGTRGPTSARRPRRPRYPVTRRLTKFTSGAHDARRESIEFRYSLARERPAVRPLSLTC